jgi:hypothetical protein
MDNVFVLNVANDGLEAVAVLAGPVSEEEACRVCGQFMSADRHREANAVSLPSGIVDEMIERLRAAGMVK